MTKKAPAKINKGDLMLALQELLNKNTVSTQEEMRAALHKLGFVVNQTKISRLLHKLGAVKMIENDETIYRLQHERFAMTTKDSLKFVITSIKHNESLIIVRTAPGSAPLVAHLLDNNNDLAILGTVAGDDTVFIAPESIKNLKILFNEIRYLLLKP